MDRTLLEDVGLTKGEIKVYFTLLKIGETTTGKIIEEAQISAGKVYQILDKLIRKGLATYIMKEKTRYYDATSPESILDFIEEKEKDLKDKGERIKKELPALLAFQKEHVRTNKTRIFTGLKGIGYATAQALNAMETNDEVIVMGVQAQRTPEIARHWKNWHRDRVAKGISCRIIFTGTGTDYYEHFMSLKRTSVRVLESVTPSPICIYGQKLHIYTYGAVPTCLEIEHEDIRKSFLSFFETLWSLAK